ncbi:MAG: hypothetical protein IJ563_11525 [Selenomonadaceae bacterium]|nr:hypothetical protein [Selenomonadaceae bacterium]
MATPVKLIRRFVQGLIKAIKEDDLTGEKALDSALKSLNVSGLTSFAKLRENFAKDMRQYTGTTSGNSYNPTYTNALEESRKKFLEKECGIRINNSDTGAITGSDAGGEETKTAQSIIPETYEAEELTDAEYNSFTKNGLTLNITYCKPKYTYELESRYDYNADLFLSRQKDFVSHMY